MKIDGILEGAQLEILSNVSPTPTPLGRVYVDITDVTAGLLKLYDGTAWRTLQSQKHATRTATTTDSVLTTDEVLLYSAAGASFVATLPTAASMSGRILYIKKTDTTFNTVTIHGNGAELVDGTNTVVLYTYGEWMQMQSNGTSWALLGWGFYEGKTAYTPTTGAGCTWLAGVSVYAGYWWRTGNRLNVEIKLAMSGAVTNVPLLVNIPVGAVIDTSQMLSATIGVTPADGRAVLYDSSAVLRGSGFMCYQSTTTLCVLADDGLGALVSLSATVPFTWAVSDTVNSSGLNLPMVGWRG